MNNAARPPHRHLQRFSSRGPARAVRRYPPGPVRIGLGTGPGGRGQVGHLRLAGQPQLGLAGLARPRAAEHQGPGRGRRPAGRLAQEITVVRQGHAPQRAPAGQLRGGDPVVEVDRGHDGSGPDQPALPQAAELPGTGDQVEQRNVVRPGGRSGLGYRAGGSGDQQPAAVRGGHVPPAGQPPDDMTSGPAGGRPGAAGRLAARPVAAADPQRPVDDGQHGRPAAPGGPPAGAGRAAAAGPGPPIRAAGAEQLNVHTVGQSPAGGT